MTDGQTELAEVKPGKAVLWDVDNDEYHATDEAVGSSMLKTFLKSPPRYHGLYVTGTIPKPDPTLDMQIGSWTHTLVLEPLKFHNQYALAPNVDRRTRAGKTDYNNWLTTIGTRQIISKDDAKHLDKADGMAASVLAHPMAAKLLATPGRVEQAILWRDPVTEILCKVKPDKLLVGAGYSADLSLKTDIDSTAEAFGRTCVNRKYDLQAALYTAAIAALTSQPASTTQIVVGKTEPYDVFVYPMKPVWIRAGQHHVHDALCRLQICREAADWTTPGQNMLSDLPMPKWYERTLGG